MTGGDFALVTNLVGFIASGISFVLWLPQAITVWKSRNSPELLAAVSLGTQYLVLANASLWGVYAVMTNAFWTGAPGIINAPLAIVIILIVRGANRHGATRECRCGWGSLAGHRVFITAPPGYGTLLPCTPASAARGFPIAFDERRLESAPATPTA